MKNNIAKIQINESLWINETTGFPFNRLNPVPAAEPLENDKAMPS